MCADDEPRLSDLQHLRERRGRRTLRFGDEDCENRSRSIRAYTRLLVLGAGLLDLLQEVLAASQKQTRQDIVWLHAPLSSVVRLRKLPPAPLAELTSTGPRKHRSRFRSLPSSLPLSKTLPTPLTDREREGERAAAPPLLPFPPLSCPSKPRGPADCLKGHLLVLQDPAVGAALQEHHQPRLPRSSLLGSGSLVPKGEEYGRRGEESCFLFDLR